MKKRIAAVLALIVALSQPSVFAVQKNTDTAERNISPKYRNIEDVRAEREKESEQEQNDDAEYIRNREEKIAKKLPETMTKTKRNRERNCLMKPMRTKMREFTKPMILNIL